MDVAGAESPAEYVTDQHGTRHLYQYHHCRCVLCTAANSTYSRTLRRLHAYGHPPLGVKVPATETARQLRYLLSEGFCKADIARGLGLRWPRLKVQTGPGQWITRRNALKIQRLYRQWAE